uniref:CKLF-like MARVEL transmembrane domain containing 3 n=1 Tax=Cyprinus carpio TaxID=7962 RepID=A0A8C2BZP2_CYPCA
MGDIEAPENNRSRQSIIQSLLPSKEFITSRKGLLLLGEVVMSFISFVCFAASAAASFVTAPLIEFLAALFLLFAYSTEFNERFKGFYWPLMDFLRCVSASIIFFIISIISVSKYVDGASKAAGVGSHQFSQHCLFLIYSYTTCDFCGVCTWFHVSVFLSLSLLSYLALLPQYSSPWTFISSSMNWLTSSREVIPVRNHQTHKMMTLTLTLTKAVIVSKILVCVTTTVPDNQNRLWYNFVIVFLFWVCFL